MSILTIAHLTLLESRRRKILLAAFVCGLAFVAVFATALVFAQRSMEAEKTSLIERRMAIHGMTVAALYVANFLILMTATLLPVDTLSGEISSGVTQTLASKPIRRSEIVMGKWLAHWIVACSYLILTAGGLVLASRLVSGFFIPGLARSLPLMLLAATVMMTVTIAGGTRFTTITNGLVAIGVFGLAFVGGWLEQIGEMIATGRPEAMTAVRNIGTIASLLNPADSLWRLAAYHMLPSILRDLALTPLTQMFPPSNAMIVWAVLYVVAMLTLALKQFQRRAL